jgi:outer membrane protein, multidrug efflux system
MRNSLLVLAAALVSGCMMGPDYQRPTLEVPQSYRGQLGAAEAASLADQPWWEVFHDPVLQRLVRQALENNLDLRQAIARVEQAQAQVKVVHSPIFPQLGYGAAAARQSGPIVTQGSIDSVTYNSYVGSVGLSWELDIWGKVRRATEAAQAEMLATEDFQRGVMLTLLSGVAASYFQLLAQDRELEIARETVALYGKTVGLFRDKYEGGASSLLPVNRAAAQLANTAANIPELERRIADTENRLSILLGRAPGAIPRGEKLTEQKGPPAIPPGLPSQLLERRPDVRQSEEQLVAENARIGVAKANFFPSLSLTGLFGGQSTHVSSVLNGSSTIWSFGAGLVGPIFTGGRLTGEYEAQESRWKQAKANYEQTVLNALGEVSNALVGQQKLTEIRTQRELAVQELQSSVGLSLDRYLVGAASYFEVLQAEEQFYFSQQALVQTQVDQLINIVQLYRALGGGWQQQAATGTPDPGSAPAKPMGMGTEPDPPIVAGTETRATPIPE